MGDLFHCHNNYTENLEESRLTANSNMLVIEWANQIAQNVVDKSRSNLLCTGGLISVPGRSVTSWRYRWLFWLCDCERPPVFEFTFCLTTLSDMHS